MSAIGKREWLALLVILLLAGWLRLGWPGVVEFKRDEANLSQLSFDLAHGKSFPLLGISSSVGIPNSPMSVYVLALPYLFSSSPVVATQYIGLLNVIAIGLTYILARRYFGVRAALVAVLLYAVSPWGVIYSRKIWAQDMLPPFVVGVFLAGLLGFYEGKRWARWLTVPLLAIAVQIHYSAFVLVVPTAFVVWHGRRWWDKAAWGGLFIAGLLFAPFAAGVGQAVLPDFGVVQQVMTGESDPQTAQSLWDGSTLQYAGLLISGSELHSLAGASRFRDYLAQALPLLTDASLIYPLFGVLAWASLLALLGLIARMWRQRQVADGMLVLWVIAPILAFSLRWTVGYPHYLIPMMPAAFVTFGVGATRLWDWLSARGRWGFVGQYAALAWLVVVVVTQVLMNVSIIHFVDAHHTPDGFGTPLWRLMQVREAVLADQPSALIGYVGGQAIGYDDEPTVWRFLLADMDNVRFGAADTWLYPREGNVVLDRACEGHGTIIRLRDSQSCYRVYSDETSSLPIADHTAFNADRYLANGVRIVSYQWQSESQCLNLFWEISRPTRLDYHFAVHFVDGDGRELVNADGLSWYGVYWQAGDRLIRTFCVPEAQKPSGFAIVGANIGMYTYDGVNFQGVDWLDGNNTPVGQAYLLTFND